MRRRRHVRVPPDLTSLFDVLFIVIFACLIRAAAADKSAAAAAARPPQVITGTPVIVRVAARGELTALEEGGKVTSLAVAMLEHDPDPAIGLAYLGDRAEDQRVCRVVALHLGSDDLAKYVIIVAPDRPLADFSHALVEGLLRDVERCATDQHGHVVIVEPEMQTP